MRQDLLLRRCEQLLLLVLYLPEVFMLNQPTTRHHHLLIAKKRLAGACLAQLALPLQVIMVPLRHSLELLHILACVFVRGRLRRC